MKRNDSAILEFKIMGYVRPDANSNILKQLRKKYGEYFKIFDSAVFRYHGRNPRYSSLEMFGGRLIYYYDTRREEDFVNFIVKKMYDKNPQPNKEMRSAFTRILHHHKLCWFGCYHGGKKVKIFEEDENWEKMLEDIINEN